jgi:hypothetical protein
MTFDFISLAAHRFGISNICYCFLQAGGLEKTKQIFKIQNSTRPIIDELQRTFESSLEKMQRQRSKNVGKGINTYLLRTSG